MTSNEQLSHSSLICQHCSVVFDVNNPAERHNRSRTHINHLLRLGLEISIDDSPLVADSDGQDGTLPEIPMCTVCEISAGNTPAQAALHYRSREHINKRLQKGLQVALTPAAASVDDEIDERNYMNHCLRLGIQPSSVAQRSAVKPLRPEGVNGKRKLPAPAMHLASSSSPPGSLSASFSGFAQGKRACRPITSGCRPLLAPTSFNAAPVPLYRPPQGLRTQSQITRVRHVSPAAQWNLTSEVGGCFDRVPPAAIGQPTPLYNDHVDHQPSVLYTDQRNTPTVGPYEQQSRVMFSNAHSNVYSDRGSLSNEGWFCDLCNIALPTIEALSHHTTSAEHRMAAEWSRAQGTALYQPS